MTERTGDEAARLALTDLADALERYLEAKGWQVLAVSDHPRVQKVPDTPALHYEFAVRFTGQRGKDA